MEEEQRDLEKQIFNEKWEKQSKLAKKVLLITFMTIGLIFLILGLVLLISINEKEIGIVYLILGPVFMVIAVITYFAIPNKYNYDKYKKRVDKYGYMNMFEMNAKIIELEERINELENKK